jgi:hypothetical protein
VVIGGIYLLGPRLGLWTPGGKPGPDAETKAKQAGEEAIQPVQFDQPLQQAILAMPEFSSPAKAGQGGAKGPLAGKLELAEQTPRSDGSHVLHVWADTQKQGLAGQTVDVRVLMEVWLDASGKPVQAREIGQKDPDMVAFENAIDKMKM